MSRRASRIVLRREGGCWTAETVEPLAARELNFELFGTTRIPTPFDAGLLGSYVQNRIRQRNPNATVAIDDPAEVRS